MNIIERLRRAVVNNVLFASLYRFIGNGTPIQINDTPRDYIEDGYAGNPDVYSIINRICVYARNVGKDVKKYEDEELVTDNESYIKELILNPNPYQGENEFWDKIIAYLEITGNVFIYKLKLEGGVNSGKVAELHVMPSDRVEIIGSGNPLKPIKGYRVEGYFQDEIPAEDVIHIRFANLSTYANDGSDFYGMSPLKAARSLVTQSNDTYTANMKALQNSGAVGMLSGEKDEEYDEAQLQQVQKRYDEKYGGVHNKGKVIISSKPLKWVNMGISPKDLQTFEGQEISLKHLCNLYGVPLPLLNSDASTFDNMNTAEKSMYSNCVIPLLDYIVDELNRGLKDELNGSKICLVTSHVDALQTDKLKKVQWMRAAGTFRQSEIRAALDYPAIEGDPILKEEMQEVYIPNNIRPMGEEAPNQIPNLNE